MTITFIGHGYVGLVSAAVFADLPPHLGVVQGDPEPLLAPPGVRGRFLCREPRKRQGACLGTRQAAPRQRVDFDAGSNLFGSQ